MSSASSKTESREVLPLDQSSFVLSYELPTPVESRIKLFTDDAKMHNSPQGTERLQADMNALGRMSKDRCLSINPQKCKTMHYRSSNNMEYVMKEKSNIQKALNACYSF